MDAETTTLLLTLVPLLLVVGAFAGVLAGLLGVGGGIVVVPALYHIFGYLDVADAVRMHLAVGTSLATTAAEVSIPCCSEPGCRALLWACCWAPGWRHCPISAPSH